MQWPKTITDLVAEETHFGKRTVKCFSRRPLNINNVFNKALARNPTGDALVADQHRLSYAQLDKLVEELIVVSGVAIV